MDLSALTHRARRAFLKKAKRKRIRQALAEDRERLIEEDLIRRQSSPSYHEQIRLEVEQQQVEDSERERLEEEWLKREERAQLDWAENQRQKNLHADSLQENAHVVLPLESDTPIANVDATTIKIQQSEKTTVNANLPPWHHPPLPENMAPLPQPAHVCANITRPEPCSFFRKTGACRFGIRCSRSHDYPQPSDADHQVAISAPDTEDWECFMDECPVEEDNSCLVLCLPKMFQHLSLPPVASDSMQIEDPDAGLEVDEAQLNSDYDEFYTDVRTELESRWGRVSCLRTCRNRTEHLRGNVYVEFARGAKATWEAADDCQGRWFAGRQITCFVVRLCGGWREAVCGLYHRGRCPKGDFQCNFLHVFLNPGEIVNDLHKALRLQVGELPRFAITSAHENSIATNSKKQNHKSSRAIPIRGRASKRSTVSLDFENRRNSSYDKEYRRGDKYYDENTNHSLHRSQRKHRSSKRHQDDFVRSLDSSGRQKRSTDHHSASYSPYSLRDRSPINRVHDFPHSYSHSNDSPNTIMSPSSSRQYQRKQSSNKRKKSKHKKNKHKKRHSHREHTSDVTSESSSAISSSSIDNR